jgi:predicted amidophosphoribosyltransferase
MESTHRHAPMARTRRMIGVQRSYRCDGCGAEARSWTRLSLCPRCGEHLTTAVIDRAAFARS